MTANERKIAIENGVVMFLTGCYSNGVTVQMINGVKLTGRGVKTDYNNGHYYVTDKFFDKIKTQYKYTTDF